MFIYILLLYLKSMFYKLYLLNYIQFKFKLMLIKVNNMSYYIN